jgi:hypothetical protein
MKIAEMTKGELAERLILSVLNTSDVKDRILNFPSIDKGSFSLVVQLFLGEKNYENRYTSCINVTNDILNGWNNSIHLNKDELFSMAIENSRKQFPVLVEPINEFIDAEHQNGSLFEADGVNIPRCFVLSNELFYNGAAAMFYEPEILSKIAKKLNTSELYLLPSSTNHIFCVPHSNILSKEEVEEIFSSLDAVDAEMGLSEQAGLAEKLSEHIITYDASKNMLIEKSGVSYFPEINALSGKEQSAEMARNPVHR